MCLVWIPEIEKEDQLLNPVMQSRNQAMAKMRESQQQFILVASLVDRIPNLAGLARTCEVCVISRVLDLRVPPHHFFDGNLLTGIQGSRACCS